MQEQIKKAVETYQCPGCVRGSDTSCYSINSYGEGCGLHRSGTYISSIGKILLGMPKGFNRVGDMSIVPRIFSEYQDNYDVFNVPVWKYIDKHGNTIVRGIQPRINTPFIDIFLGNHLDSIDCLCITDDMLAAMD